MSSITYRYTFTTSISSGNLDKVLFRNTFYMEFVAEGVKYEEKYFQNSRGINIFSCSWLPSDTQAKALVFLCHPYAAQCSIAMKDTGLCLAKSGFAVYGMDYEGHGKSSGLLGYIPSFDAIVSDCSDHFISICEREENKKAARMLLGQLMGAAVAIHLHWRKPSYWDGAVLLTPLCKLADKLKPHPIVIKVFEKLARFFPTLRIAPTPNLFDVSFRLPEVREEIQSCPYFYKGRPRLRTAYQILDVTLDMEQRLEEVSLPLLVLHGGTDKVTDPELSELLYESASSKDKTLKVYPGMWHHLLFGELPKNIQTVLSDVVTWLDDRVESISKL